MNVASTIFQVNRFEKSVLLSFLVVSSLLLATVGIVTIANLLGISIGTPEINKIVNGVSNGGKLGVVFAAVMGVTVPAWALTAVVVLGLTSA